MAHSENGGAHVSPRSNVKHRGVWTDVLCRFNPGDRVFVLMGERIGEYGTVVGMEIERDEMETESAAAVYRVKLDGDLSAVPIKWGHIAKQAP